MDHIIPVVSIVPLVLAVLTLVANRGAHSEDSKGADVFRISPFIAWAMTIFSFVFFSICIYISQTISGEDIPVMITGGGALFLFGAYGVYCISMRICVDSCSLCVKSILGAHVTRFTDLRSVRDTDTGKWRTLDVIDVRGKRVLYVTSSFLPDYDLLVDMIQSGISSKEQDVRNAETERRNAET